AYESATKTLYLGYRVAGVIGDTDGNNDPNTAGGAGCVAGANITDSPGIALSESYVWWIDTNCDGAPDIQISVSGLLSNLNVRIANGAGETINGASAIAIASGSDIKLKITGISDPNTGQAGLPAVFRFSGFVGATNDGL